MLAFLDEHGATLRPQSLRRYETSAKALFPMFKGKYLDQIARGSLKDFETRRRQEGASAPTIRRDLACLSSMFGFEIENERADANPVPAFLKARKKRGLRESAPRTRYLTHDEEAALLGAAPAHLEPMIAFAIDTGLRLEEQLSLTWPQVDPARNEITVLASKTGEGRRVPLLERAGTYLGTHPTRLRPAGGPDWVFSKRDGSRYGKLNKGLGAAARRAGLDDLRWHDLRRTCGCRLLQDHRMTMAEVSRWLGHKSSAVTERSYAFLDVDHLHAAIRSGTKTGTGRAD